MKQTNYQPTAVNEYFAWLEQTVSPNTPLYRAAHSYLEQLRTEDQEQTTDNAPFLSIVMRTQGKRPQMLTEALLSLTGQSNTDFEVLLMGHNLSAEQLQTVSEIVSDQPDWMRERIRLIPVTGGTRTTPLNRGFEEAVGRYIAVLDDDDLVFDHWVQSFCELAERNAGKVLHTYTVVQDWEVVSKKMPDTPRAANAPSTAYCQDFKLLDNLMINHCPLCALAFPSEVFHRLGIRFDESLTTTEDWDYLMRVACLVGVADSPQITFLYRRWLNAENSATIHAETEWINNYTNIVKRFVETPILFPSGSLHGIIDKNTLQEDERTDSGSEELILPEQDLFYDDGSDFSDTKRFRRDLRNLNNRFEYLFVPNKKSQPVTVTRLRFDPHFYGFITVKEFTASVTDDDGNTEEYTMEDVYTNGYRLGNRIAFLKNDPQIIFDLKQPVCVREIKILCRVRHYVSDEDLETILQAAAKQPSLLYRAARKCYLLLKKCFKKCFQKA